MGEHQARLVARRVSKEGITHIITSDLGRTRRTAQIIAEACGCEVICDPRLRELHMGVLEERLIDSLTPQEEQWRKQMVDGTLTAVSLKANPWRSWASACAPRWRAA